MKNSILKISSLLLITTLLVTSCNSSSDKLEKSEENLMEVTEELDNAKADFLAEVEEFKVETSAQIEKNDKLIDDFEAKIKESGKEVKAVYKEKVAELKQANEDLKDRLSKYKAEDKSGWQKFKEEFSSDMKKLGNAFKDLTVDNEK